MASLEYRILTKILADQSMKEALRLGLGEEHFKDPEAKRIFRYVQQHWYNPATFKSVPPIVAIKRRWPSFEPTEIEQGEQAMRALIEEQKALSFESDALTLANHFQEMVEVDPLEAVKTVQSEAVRLMRLLEGRVGHIGVDGVAERARQHYEDAKAGSLHGIPWPWDPLTQDTLGKRPGDFIVLYGRMKSMKTWVALFCAVYDYMVNNCRVLIWSREMSQDKMAVRVASILAKVDYQLFKKGRLPQRHEKRALKLLEQLSNRSVALTEEDIEQAQSGGRDLMLLCGRDAPPTLEAFKDYCDHYQPDIAYLDSYYHMTTARSERLTQRWQRQACLTEDVKTGAEDMGIPIVAVTQANRDGEKTHGDTLSDLADTDVIGREADLIIRIIRKGGKILYEKGYEVTDDSEEEEEAPPPQKRIRVPGRRIHKPPINVPKKVQEEIDDREQQKRMGAELALVMGGNREGVLEAITINAVPGYNFSLISADHTMDDIAEWSGLKKGKKGDSEGIPAPAKKVERPKFKPGALSGL